MGVIKFAGRSSEDFRVVVEHYPDYPSPERNVEIVAVPGRNGDLHFDGGNFRNYPQRYDVYLSAMKDGLPTVAANAAAWLFTPVGYQRLEDSYNPDVFRMAYFAGPMDIASVFNRFGRTTLEFECKPQRWLKSGEETVSITASGAVVSNPTAFAALPYIKVYGSGAGELSVGQITCTFLDIDEYIELDSDLQNAYKETDNKNSTVSIPQFPALQPGDNAITWSGGITSIEIVPRWWTI